MERQWMLLLNVMMKCNSYFKKFRSHKDIALRKGPSPSFMYTHSTGCNVSYMYITVCVYCELSQIVDKD